jgi:hypothetical protein
MRIEIETDGADDGTYLDAVWDHIESPAKELLKTYAVIGLKSENSPFTTRVLIRRLDDLEVN